ncbi:hypothetical protein H4696_003567 [Amycolatopsis lexingtonensis]|uniref:Uncharacterized protein n=1 Tax=Amycolatopsis lexingtonensis TaxID=218822 RepID=A0ABR9HZU6_9PSEU|nr:hypothetical protein [Amycolatopsis lexingtonensis]MBE1496467.1 hypothetical protein [Amycolatopsis lexingtonensis]
MASTASSEPPTEERLRESQRLLGDVERDLKAAALGWAGRVTASVHAPIEVRALAWFA